MNNFMSSFISVWVAQMYAQTEMEKNQRKLLDKMRLTKEQEEKLEAIKDVLDEEEYQMLRRRMIKDNLEG